MKLTMPRWMVQVFQCLTLFGVLAGSAQAQEGLVRGWNVAHFDTLCYLRHASTITAEGIYLDYRYRPGSTSGELSLQGRGRRSLLSALGKSITVRLAPSGTEQDGKLIAVDSYRWGDYWQVAYLDKAFVEAMATAETLELSRDGETLLSVDLRDAKGKLAEFHSCADKLLREWGVDVDALASLRAPPIAEPWISPADIPERVSGGLYGMVVVRLAIDAGGHVTDCTVVRPSRHEALNSRTCELALTRARFSPAIGPDGGATAVTVVNYVDWGGDG